MPRSLVAPSKLAQSLDWRKQSGYILSVHVGQSKIDLAATCHPDYDGNPIQPLPSIPLKIEVKKNQKVLKSEVVAEISNIVQRYNTLGMVVSWPVQKEGWCGASCGKVLHVLDQVIQEGAGMGKQPICLWNGRHWTSGEDEWGRAPIYSVPTSKKEHRASKEQYGDDGMVATAIAKDFLDFHWPNLVDSREQRVKIGKSSMDKTDAHRTETSKRSRLAKSLICDRF